MCYWFYCHFDCALLRTQKQILRYMNEPIPKKLSNYLQPLWQRMGYCVLYFCTRKYTLKKKLLATDWIVWLLVRALGSNGYNSFNWKWQEKYFNGILKSSKTFELKRLVTIEHALHLTKWKGRFYLCGDSNNAVQVLKTSASSVEGSFVSWYRPGPLERQWLSNCNQLRLKYKIQYLL